MDKLTLWVVKLGNMYYLGEGQKLPRTEKLFSCEFVKDEEVAFLFANKEIARNIAERCGGTIIEKEYTSRKYNRLTEKWLQYTESEQKVQNNF